MSALRDETAVEKRQAKRRFVGSFGKLMEAVKA
jgi:hypothetical protein